jgi:hypothetical protein
MTTFKMEALQPPGLRPIKQVELFKKIRPFIPRAHWAELCPKPSEEVMDMVKQERSDNIKSNIVGDSQSTDAKKETKKRFQNEAFQRKQTAKAERAQKMAERESIEAAKAIERKQKKDQRDWMPPC